MSTINVLRYTAVALGALVGFKTDFSLKSEASRKQEENKYQTELKLIEKAKAEYALLQVPQQTKAPISEKKLDLEDPNLDYGAVILTAVEGLKQ
ncbi:LAMI_0C04522g1_1 [Lachancea mirantina]|uniref:ATP synthase F(0) complex subunit e, mitochondrial n=1 Tax=Lachancea mirantina TaxID=1230905 RepID=A0A1G4J254_9SACH|nr:LAMI_0C04522g1_1 [Lachancea mirantina]